MTTPYKRCEKRWKALTPAQALADPHLLDVHRFSVDHQQRVRVVGSWTAADGAERPILAFDGYGAQHEGFFVIPRALDGAAQLELAHACLYDVYIVVIVTLACACAVFASLTHTTPPHVQYRVRRGAARH